MGWPLALCPPGSRLFPSSSSLDDTFWHRTNGLDLFIMDGAFSDKEEVV
jgi:hypothetical protein